MIGLIITANFQLDPDAWSKTISTINAEFAEAEKVCRATAMER